VDQKYITLFDRYTHGGMSRREFLDKLSLMAGSTAAATALLPILENNYARAETVPENAPDLVIQNGEIAQASLASSPFRKMPRASFRRSW
jgi:carboxymethylenebutenolidase